MSVHTIGVESMMVTVCQYVRHGLSGTDRNTADCNSKCMTTQLFFYNAFARRNVSACGRMITDSLISGASDMPIHSIGHHPFMKCE